MVSDNVQLKNQFIFNFSERIFVNDQTQVKDHFMFMSFDSTTREEFIVILIFDIYKRSIYY